MYLEVGASPDAYNAQYLPRYNQIINIESPMTINSSILNNNGTYTLNANIGLVENFDNSNVKVVFILARNIDSNYYSSVVAYQIQNFNLSTSGQNGAYSQTFDIDPSWDSSTIKGYVMVQKWLSSNSQIYQAAEAN